MAMVTQDVRDRLAGVCYAPWPSLPPFTSLSSSLFCQYCMQDTCRCSAPFPCPGWHHDLCQHRNASIGSSSD
eukprot:745917-Amphidinium_carterae.1